MTTATFAARRGALQTYFDRTASDAWKQLTSDAPVSRIRATVRAGRNTMHAILMGWLPEDLAGARVLDAGCGTGALAFKLAARGGSVIATDVSASLIEIARERMPAELPRDAIEFRCGDMLQGDHGPVDYVVAMDSLIHYETRDIVSALVSLGRNTARKMVVTVAPRTPALATMHALGSLFPRGNRAPAIVPAHIPSLCRTIAAEPNLADWQIGRTERVTTGFYMSHAIELVRR
jgi:magnesium-protoporphyrin O-methyltransferase